MQKVIVIVYRLRHRLSSSSIKISHQNFFPIKKNVHIYFLVQSGAASWKTEAPASGFKKKK